MMIEHGKICELFACTKFKIDHVKNILNVQTCKVTFTIFSQIKRFFHYQLIILASLVHCTNKFNLKMGLSSFG